MEVQLIYSWLAATLQLGQK